MREIKFRGMTISGDWVYGLLAYTESKSLACGDTGYFISNKAGAPFAYQIRPETISEFTGLKDKNGKEIYEGDVVKVTDNSKEKYYPEYIGQIDYSQGGFWCVKHSGYGGTGYYLSDLQHDTQRRNAILEVIGNIYENPELLK